MSAATSASDAAPSAAQQLAANTIADLVRLIGHHEEQRAGKAAVASTLGTFAQGMARFDFRVSFDARSMRLSGAEVTAMGRRVVVDEVMYFDPGDVAAAIRVGGGH